MLANDEPTQAYWNHVLAQCFCSFAGATKCMPFDALYVHFALGHFDLIIVNVDAGS